MTNRLLHLVGQGCPGDSFGNSRCIYMGTMFGKRIGIIHVWAKKIFDNLEIRF
jgi:hypothetical protein